MLQPEEESIIRAVFSSYDKERKGYLNFNQFTLLLSRLSKHVPDLKGVELEAAQGAFSLFSKKAPSQLQYHEFRSWWLKDDKYTYLVGERAKLVQKAYMLYKKYAASSPREKTRGEEKTTIPVHDDDAPRKGSVIIPRDRSTLVPRDNLLASTKGGIAASKSCPDVVGASMKVPRVPRIPSPVDQQLSLDKFLMMMEDLGIRGTVDNFDQLDLNGDGMLNFEEFSKWLKWF